MGLVDDIDRDGDELVRGLIAGARKMTPESEMNSGSSTSQKPFSIVIVNPNSNESMTKGLEDAVSYIKDDKVGNDNCVCDDHTAFLRFLLYF